MGRSVDWGLLEPLLRISHAPAAVQAADVRFARHPRRRASWRRTGPTPPRRRRSRSRCIGVCPGPGVVRLRVLPDNPADKADEFTIIAALQFIRYLNANKNLMLIHGVNLSLSVPHDVANYACGRTPVCEECERVVASGVVVVTAAGNRGFDKREREPAAYGDYRYISITDPGNADGVITVGSTHRMLPHNYGVSYFSSRGPTGDGRTQAGPRRAGRADRLVRAERLLRNDGRHEHGGASRERRGGAAVVAASRARSASRGG